MIYNQLWLEFNFPNFLLLDFIGQHNGKQPSSHEHATRNVQSDGTTKFKADGFWAGQDTIWVNIEKHEIEQ